MVRHKRFIQIRNQRLNRDFLPPDIPKPAPIKLGLKVVPRVILLWVGRSGVFGPVIAVEVRLVPS